LAIGEQLVPHADLRVVSGFDLQPGCRATIGAVRSMVAQLQARQTERERVGADIATAASLSGPRPSGQ